MKRMTLLSLVIMLSGSRVIEAQTPDPLSFFPHHKGDIWEYYYPNPWVPPKYEQNIITLDSLGPDGRFYIKTTLLNNFILDTTSLWVYRTFSEFDTVALERRYKLDADSGDYWIVSDFDTLGRESAKVIDVYWTYLFGDDLVLMKEIDYYGFGPPWLDSLLDYTDYLASGFGIVGQDFDTFPVRRIRGTLINGALNGTVTSVGHNRQHNVPTRTELHQNFPNPFNSATLISYDIGTEGLIELTVFDLLGKEVRVLVRERQEAGHYIVKFDATGMASGVYLYTLKTAIGFKTNKMVLIR